MLHPIGRRPESLQPFHDMVKVHSGCMADRCSRTAVDCIMQPRGMNRDVTALLLNVQDEAEVTILIGLNFFSPDLRVMVQPLPGYCKSHRFIPLVLSTQPDNMFIIKVNHMGCLLITIFKQFTFGRGNTLYTAKSLQMSFIHIGDAAYIGIGNLREPGYFTRTGASWNHADAAMKSRIEGMSINTDTGLVRAGLSVSPW